MTPGNNNGNPGDNGVNGDTLDNMKQSPGTAPTTPRDSGGGSEPLPDFNLPNFPPPGNSVSDRDEDNFHSERELILFNAFRMNQKQF